LKHKSARPHTTLIVIRKLLPPTIMMSPSTQTNHPNQSMSSKKAPSSKKRRNTSSKKNKSLKTYDVRFQIPANLEAYSPNLNNKISHFKKTTVYYTDSDNEGMVNVCIQSKRDLEMRLVARACIDYYNNVIRVINGIF
jgi:hypothetical protein